MTFLAIRKLIMGEGALGSKINVCVKWVAKQSKYEENFTLAIMSILKKMSVT